MIASTVLELQQFAHHAIGVHAAQITLRPLSDHSERTASAEMAPEGKQPRNAERTCYRQERNAQLSIL
jgi:hypothetical protein